MKILITTMIPTDKIHPRTYVFKKIIDSLKSRTFCEVNWIMCYPYKTSNSKQVSDYIDIHNFSNALQMLNKLKPDLIFVDPQIEPIQYAISICAKKLNIPIIARPPIVNYFPSQSRKSNILYKLRNFFSSENPSGELQDKKFFSRGSFFLYKINFYFKTKLDLNVKFLNAVFSTIRYFRIIAISRTQLPVNLYADLHLLASENQINDYIKNGISQSKLKVVGNVWIDKNFNNISKVNYNIKNNKIKILIVTTPLFEHGVWSSSQRDEFLKKLFSILTDDKFDISLKIHPTSENINYYRSLLNKLDISCPIFQSEDIWTLIPNYDLFISYGPSQVLGDLAFSQRRTITISIGKQLLGIPLVKEAISSGFITECQEITQLKNTVISVANSIPKPNQEYLNEIKKLFFNFDGKSSERCAEVIVSFMNDKH
ncbi:hypothetical protein [Nitrosarchaeum sp.]|uniref:polysialyltransferase family glycosyltransferase n=1 Tax=Nitrosarchaeum sp. TaxID=2026886 RepID=UPI00247C7691|nr:hypothetical protein [Nitrosarchaeum sp.]MCV0411924.1 hypothetical protein [Nitrosarchaeum sp.]